MDTDGVLEKTKDGYAARFERHLKHPVAKVWAALTEPGQFKKWFGGPVIIEPVTGGRFLLVNENMNGKVFRFEPMRVFEHTFGDESRGDFARWELFPEGAGTRLVLTQFAKAHEDWPRDMAGWHCCLDVLALVLAGDTGEDHAPPTIEPDKERPGRGAWEHWPSLREAYQRKLG